MSNKFIQRYISDELTHFVGKNKSQKEQYNILVKILKEGLLTPDHNDPEKAGYIAISLNGRISDNKMFMPYVICFCDIPINDLYIHMKKYSQFGIGFLKEFLVPKGANPLFYIAKNSRIKTSEVASTAIKTTSRADYFDEMFLMCHNLFDELRSLVNNHASSEHRTVVMKKIAAMDLFLIRYIFSFLKFFDDVKKDDDPENYYMEREWRMIDNFSFKMKDVCRVILPKSYAKLFRKDVPEFIGQVSFAD